jgi:class 3 adenylate cyclase
MRARGLGPIVLAAALALLPAPTWAQMGRGMMPGRRDGGSPAAQPASSPGRQAAPSSLGPGLLLLVVAVGASGVMATYRLIRHRGGAAASFVTEAVLVVDLVQSTHLATHYGDGLAMKARTILRDRTLAVAQRHGFVFTESTGDGAFMTFRSVGSAIGTALTLLAELRERPPDLAPAPPLSIRAGIAYGEIRLDGRGARHGAVINKAFRLEGLQPEAFVHVDEDGVGPEIPRENRVFLDEEAAQEARAGAFTLAPAGFARLKGFTGLHRVYQIVEAAPVWPDRSLTTGGGAEGLP